jgi:hypothetical protein
MASASLEIASDVDGVDVTPAAKSTMADGASWQIFLACLAPSGMPKDSSERRIPSNPTGKTAGKSARRRQL